MRGTLGWLEWGSWNADLKQSVQDISAAFLSLNCFLQFLMGHQVLVRMDNTTPIDCTCWHAD